LKFCENLNFITFDKLNINLGKLTLNLGFFLRFFENRAPGSESRRYTADSQNGIHEISRETSIRLRCYEIITSLVVAFYWNTD